MWPPTGDCQDDLQPFGPRNILYGCKSEVWPALELVSTKMEEETLMCHTVYELGTITYTIHPIKSC
jgi:hypothetical protein